MLGLYVALFAWIAFSFMSVVIGFFAYIFGDAGRLKIQPADEPLPEITTRCALLVPTDTRSRVACSRALGSNLEVCCAHEADGAFRCVSNLSDTADPEIWIEEEMRFFELREKDRCPSADVLRTSLQQSLKDERLATSLTRHGGSAWDHEFGDRARCRQSDDRKHDCPAGTCTGTSPSCGPYHSNSANDRQCDYSVCEASAVRQPRLWPPRRLWDESWRHCANELLGRQCDDPGERVRRRRRLPTLRGPPPLGGPIMRHDFVEAALMRRMGWAVHVAPD